MQNHSRLAATALVITLALGACSPGSKEPGAAGGAAPTTSLPPAPSPVQTGDPKPTTPPATSARVLGLQGLGDLRIGQPIPSGGSWAERGAQERDTCHTVTSPDYPGVYAIVEGGKVQRITVGQRSDVTLAEGIGVGASESDVKTWFAGFREEPHKYEAAPAKYLTAPNAASGDPALRFEIGGDGKVKLIHIGMMPVLGYVEGCS
jgi:hypothetical protein